MFDSNYDCLITVYICATECRNASATPLYFHTDANKYGPPNAYKFSSGLKQSLPSNVCRLNLKQYSPQDLIHYMDNYFPIVIGIEAIFPDSYKGRCKKSIQFTYGVFSIESENEYKFKAVKQKMLYNKHIFEINDIFGKDNDKANLQDESQRECVICFSFVKDTVVLPCRHLCLCQGCSQIVRM